MTSKLIEEDEGGIEEGFLGGEENNEAFPAPRKRNSGTRNSGRGRDLGELSKVVDRSDRISEEQTAILREHLAVEREKLAGPKKSKEQQQQDDFAHRMNLATLLAESSKSIKVARDVTDSALVEVLQSNHQDLLDQFKRTVEKKKTGDNSNAP